jgi:Flp pilus assembly protein TadG
VRKFANTKQRNREAGYGLVFAAFGLIVLLGAAGLSVDIGYLRYQRRLMQSAADSAALAGAAQLGAGSGFAAANLAAGNDAQINGFQDGATVDGGTVSVSATQTAINGNGNTMQVQITNSYQTFFMRVLGNSYQNVTVSTVATAQYLGGRGCIYALTGGTGITLNGGGSIDVPNCNVISNESITGGGAITAAAVGAHVSSIGSTPPAVTGILQAPDPLSYLTAPAAGGGCNDVNWAGNQNNGGQTLNPGTYSEIVLQAAQPARGGFGGTPAKPANSSAITFNPGTYVINGCGGGAKSGGFDLEGTGTLTATRGVTFYIATGGVTIANSQPIHFDASLNGPYAGVLMFQPASNGAAATITGAGGSYMNGALYFPNATLNLDGAASNRRINYMILVAKSLNIATAVNNNSNYASLPSGYSPIRSTALVQ